MPTVDIHTHILPETLPDFAKKFGYEGFIRLEKRGPDRAAMMVGEKTFREVHRNSWDPLVRVRESDHAGVDVQVISTVPVMFSYWARPRDALDLSRFLNDQISEVVAQHPKRFVGLATVPLQDVDLAVEEMDRSIHKLGLKGVEIGSNINGLNLDNEKLLPFFSAAEKMGAAIFVHPWQMLAKERMEHHWFEWLVGMPTETALAIGSLLFGGVLEKFPKLRIAFAHGGGSFAAILGRMERGFHARPELCATHTKRSPRQQLRSIYVDSLTHDPAILKVLIDTLGADRVALGSDYPFPLGEELGGASVRTLATITEEERRKVLGETALDWLGLEAKAFKR